VKLETREYQNFIINKINQLAKNKGKNIILELDCGMGKRVLIYRLLKEVFTKEKVIVFLQTHSSLQETTYYLNNEFESIPGLVAIKSGMSSKQRKDLILNNRIILTLPLMFYNTINKYPELAEIVEIVIVNEVDTIIKRISNRDVLIVPWRKLIERLTNAKWIGMSGTLRDDHYVLDETQYRIKNELKTLLKFIPKSELIAIEDFIGTDLKNYIKNTEIHIVPVKDEKTAKIINYLTEKIKETREEIIETVKEVSPTQYYRARRDFYKTLPFLPAETEIVAKLNKLLLLRKYLYSMPTRSFKKHLVWNKITKEYQVGIPYITGKEKKCIELVMQYSKSAILCSFLSTVKNLSEILEKKGIRTFIVTGAVKKKNEVIEEYKKCQKKAVLLLSPVGERDIDIPETEALIVFDLVNSPKTVYQKMKRSRGGKVFLLFYENTAEKNKLKKVVSEIITRYPWSVILTPENE